jgi:hypothetical protein
MNNLIPQTFTYDQLYSEEINSLTLAQALELHYNLNPQFTRFDHYDSIIARNIIKAHDISHVIFGCDTSMLGEAKVQFRVNKGVEFGLDLKDKIRTLLDKDARSLLLPTGLFGFLFGHFGEIMALSKEANNKSRLMSKKWVYFKEDQYMDTTIGDIRAEYSIVL